MTDGSTHRCRVSIALVNVLIVVRRLLCNLKRAIIDRHKHWDKQ